MTDSTIIREGGEVYVTTKSEFTARDYAQIKREIENIDAAIAQLQRSKTKKLALLASAESVDVTLREEIEV
jgi:hypothetical protein